MHTANYHVEQWYNFHRKLSSNKESKVGALHAPEVSEGSLGCNATTHRLPIYSADHHGSRLVVRERLCDASTQRTTYYCTSKDSDLSKTHIPTCQRLTAAHATCSSSALQPGLPSLPRSSSAPCSQDCLRSLLSLLPAGREKKRWKRKLEIFRPTTGIGNSSP